FEDVRVVVIELDDQKRMRRIDFYDVEQVDDAWARFEAIGEDDPLAAVDSTRSRLLMSGSGIAAPDRLRIPPNGATRAHDRLVEYIKAQNWDAVRSLCAPIVFEDRRRLVRTTGDCDMFIANAKLVFGSGAQLSRTLLATSGDRLSLD